MTKRDQKNLQNDWREVVHNIKLQGNLHEQAALETIGGNAVLLDDVASRMKGGKFPTYDISCDTEIASVKSHISGVDGPSQSELSAYLHNFNEMLGYGGRSYERGLDPVQQDAERIQDLRNQGYPVPNALKKASREEVAAYLRQESVLRIPDDHVEAVQNAMRERVNNFPEEYGLTAGASEDEVNSVLNRIRPTGKTSAETIAEMRAISQDQIQSATQQMGGPENKNATGQALGQEKDISPEEGYYQGYGY